jgi:hypothetical protein
VTIEQNVQLDWLEYTMTELQKQPDNGTVVDQPEIPPILPLNGLESAKKRRTSIFKEELDADESPKSTTTSLKRPNRRVRFRSLANVFEAPNFDEMDDTAQGLVSPGYYVSLKEPVESSPRRVSSSRFIFYTCLIAIALALLHNSPLIGGPGISIIGAQGGLIRSPAREEIINVIARQDDPTNYCKRWSHQSAMVNGTIYIFGGRMTTTSNQESNTWNNDFLTLDATKTWQISVPSLTGQQQPSGPPAVANGFLWHSYDALFLYGGEFSDNPQVSPVPYALWSYHIKSQQWQQYSNPTTTAGNNSDGGNQPVQNAAEGAGISIPEIGRGYYFGGHQDFLTTAGWSIQVARIYLKSLIEFTFPGYSNDGVNGHGNEPAGQDGLWRNVTQGGIQTQDGFSERADGVLIYVPGFGQQGIILGLAGGTNVTFNEMNIIDVYDIATSTWYKQPTSGKYPSIRVNPCAVAASAPDGSSTNIYMFGGQNLQPAKDQTQYNDTWILSVPSFTWIEVDQSSQSVPAGRSGHTCEVWDGQMIVIGGYVGNEISCDSPGIYVFDMSNLQWVNNFTALSGGDPQNQQSSQSDNPYALSGSYGYQVPAAVQSAIGGSGSGGATVTGPVATATTGPLATGSAILYTVTASGSVVTETAAGSNGGPGSYNNNNSSSSGPNIAAIVAGTIAGVLFVIACYLGFCAYIYRRQLQLYKAHVAAAQRAAAAPPNEKTSFLAGARTSEDPSTRRSADASSSGPSSQRRTAGRSSIPPVPPLNIPTTPAGGQSDHASIAASSTEDLMLNHEPTFVGVLLNPRRSLRVINRD